MSGRGAGKKKASNPPKTEKDAHAHQQKLRDEKKQEKAKAAQKAPVGGGGIKKSEKK